MTKPFEEGGACKKKEVQIVPGLSCHEKVWFSDTAIWDVCNIKWWPWNDSHHCFWPIEKGSIDKADRGRRCLSDEGGACCAKAVMKRCESKAQQPFEVSVAWIGGGNCFSCLRKGQCRAMSTQPFEVSVVKEWWWELLQLLKKRAMSTQPFEASVAWNDEKMMVEIASAA